VSESEQDDLVRSLGTIPGAPLAGVMECRGTGRAEPLERLQAAVVLAELRRRLGSTMVRAYVLDEAPDEVGLPGWPARPLLPWSEQRARQVSSEVGSAVLLTNGPPGSEPFGAAADVAAGLEAGGCRVKIYDLRPEIMSLCGRVYDAAEIDDRCSFLRAGGALPPGAYLFVHPAKGFGDEVTEAIEEVSKRSGLEQADSRLCAEPMDLLAAVAGAQLVVTTSADLLAAAFALDVPGVGLDISYDDVVGGSPADWSVFAPLEGSVVARSPGELASLCAAAGGRGVNDKLVDRMARQAELAFDDLATFVLNGPRVAAAAATRVADLVEQVATLEAVNAGLRERLAAERAAMAEQLRNTSGDSRPARRRVARQADRLLDEDFGLVSKLMEAEQQAKELREELERINATRTMRMLAPARRLYGRLRNPAR
jgi:hypothetical protein